MRFIFSKQGIIVILAAAVLGGGLLVLMGLRKPPEVPPVVETKEVGPERKVIGRSVEGREIEAYAYGEGETHIRPGGLSTSSLDARSHLAFVGGIHGGYEWNSVLLAYTFLDYLDTHSGLIPENLKVTVIPSANPDAVFKVTGKEGRFTISDVSTDAEILASARFNAHKVDLNRNFDCKWKPESTWQSKKVSAGTVAFSEPEAAAIRDFVQKEFPDAVVFWHSQANAVYASECEDGILPATLDIMNAYSRAAGYKAVDSFDAYAITGDAEGWLASINIPAVTVELKTHESIDWEENLAGTLALFELYRQ